jgi:hypothetical protein
MPPFNALLKIPLASYTSVEKHSVLTLDTLKMEIPFNSLKNYNYSPYLNQHPSLYPTVAATLQ